MTPRWDFESDEERFWLKVEKTDTCWLWTATKNAKGYGRFRVGAQGGYFAHRFAYELTYGDLGDAMVDHICHNRACVNPDHLRAVTSKQNAENRARLPANTSGARGVSWHKTNRRWLVQVNHGGRNHYGGYFDTVEEAAVVARELRNRLFTHNDADRRAS